MNGTFLFKKNLNLNSEEGRSIIFRHSRDYLQNQKLETAIIAQDIF